MRSEIIEMLKRYDEIEALILEQKIDEYSDKLDDVPPGEEDVTYEQYLQRVAEAETIIATRNLEEEPDEKLGGKSMYQVFEEMGFEELTECLEYCAVNLDRGVPECLTATIAAFPDPERVKEYCANVIGQAAWTEDEVGDDNTIFEMEFQRVKACLDVLIKMEEPAFIKAVIDRFMSYPVTRDFVAESIADYVEHFPDISVPFVIEMLENNYDQGLTGPCEDLVIMLTAMGKEKPSEEIYQALRHSFRFMDNKIYAVICLADYGDDRAVNMFKNYINRNQKTIERNLFYEMMSAIQKLGGDINDIEDPFGDFTAKGGTTEEG